MPWTPQNLTDPKFVQTQLSPLDRGNALQTMTQNLTRVQSKLAENKAALDQVQDQTNGPYSFGTVRDARSAAQAAAARGDPNAAALQVKYEELLAKRQDLNAQADTLLRAVQSGEEAVQTSQTAISNLEAAGAVPPGTNQFTPPPGYDSTINPPAEVPESQNPTNTVTTNSNVENPFPLSINPNSDPNTNIGEEGQDLVYDPLQEPPSTADEFDGIDTQVAANENGLQEPPVVSDEEVNEYLNSFGNPPDDEPEPDSPNTSTRGLTAPKTNTQTQATNQDQTNFETQKDWRVRLSLAPESYYLYNADPSGILQPLSATNGVIFPYTPSVQVNYAATYDASEVTHSNYKIFQYKNSSVDNITISCDFTAQDNFEANYLLSVIHFFRTVTKMFYGQDQNPSRGTPPPLCYLTGLGSFQFNGHPLAVTGFNYSLPTDVDYIRATSTTTVAGVNKWAGTVPNNSTSASYRRMSGVGPGGQALPAKYQTAPSGTVEPTYVPTKMQISISAVPIVSRNDISNRFSLKDYATGKLLRSVTNGSRGIW